MKQRILYADVLRVIAMISVVAIHVSAIGLNDYECNTTTWMISNAVNSLLKWAVPVFFMISGMMFLNPEKEITIKVLYSKYIKRIVICILVWGSLYGLLDWKLYNSEGIVKGIIVSLFGVINGNNGYHLWFLYEILIIYMLMPIIKDFVKSAGKKHIEYALLLWFLVDICIGQYNSLVKVNDTFSIISIGIHMKMITGYIGYFILGYYLSAYDLHKNVKRILYIAALMFMVIMPIGNYCIEKVWGASGLLSQATGIGSCFIAVALFVLMKNKYKTNSLHKVIASISRYSFGIYLVHVFFVTYIFRIMNVSVEGIANIYVIPLGTIVVVILSFVSTWILSEIPVIKNIVL